MKYLIKFVMPKDDKDKAEAYEVGATETELEAKGFCTGYACAILNHTTGGLTDEEKDALSKQFSIHRIGEENKKEEKKDVDKRKKSK